MQIYVGTNDNQLIAFNVEDCVDQEQQQQQQQEQSHEGKEIQRINPLIDPIPNECISVGCLGNVTAIVRHPYYRLLYVFTSFGSYHPSIVTTFRINTTTASSPSDDDDNNNSNSRILEKLDGDQIVETGGYNVSHAVISPNKKILCVVHANDGNLSFFDISNNIPHHLQALQPPPILLRTPELRPETRTLEVPHCLPSISHVTYHYQETIQGNDDDDDDSINMALLVADTSSQGRIWVLDVDKEGIPKLNDCSRRDNNHGPIILQEHKCYPVRSPLMSFRLQQSMVMPPILPKKYTIKRVIINPNNHTYAYVLLDSHALILIYEVFLTTQNTMKLGGDCLQEVPIQVASRKSVHAGATEMLISNDGKELLVSNRSTKMSWRMGREYETLIQRYEFLDDGARLVEKKNPTTIVTDDNNDSLNQQQLQDIKISGWVEQFVLLNDNDTVVAGINTNRNNSKKQQQQQQQQGSSELTIAASSSSSIETFQRRKNTNTTGGDCSSFEKINQIDLVGTNGLSCFVVVEDDVA